jgi:cytochrome b pre-mRNA-processing protein 3
MFGWLTGRRDRAAQADALYAAINAEARSPHLYANLGVPDTTDGRFEMLALHMVLVVDRLGRIGPDGQTLGRALTETYIVAMDDAMRAIGVGDLAVPRKVKKAAAGIFDRLNSFGPALVATATNDPTVTDQWQKVLLATWEPLPGADRIDQAGLTHYVTERAKALAATPDARLLAGELSA